MAPLIQEHISDLADLCRRWRVRWLALFGSAATGRFQPYTSDLDFLVQFEPMTPKDHANAYFSLIEDLERLFQHPIDLVEYDVIRNPYFRQSVDQTRLVLYEAA